MTPISIETIQYLDPAGKITQSLPEFAKDSTCLAQFYETMMRVRAFDKKAIALQRTGKLGTYPSILGQEAMSTALGHALAKDDVFVPAYRDQAAQLQRGVRMADIYLYWGGSELGSCYENNAEDLPISVPIASQCLHATGVARAFQLRKRSNVVAVSLGDGGTSEGDFYEAMNVAGAWRLPVIFVVNNNQWAISVPLAKQTAAQSLAQKAVACGFDGIQVDGNDIIACRAVVGEAIEKARRGDGPTLIEALTYRLGDHTTADDASRYRDQSELDAAWTKEPIARLRTYLESQNAWDETREAALQKSITETIEAAVKTYENTPKQPLSSLFDYHYETWPDNLAAQRTDALSEENHHG